MSVASKKEVSGIMVIIAFATVYLVWGSTYFFIQKAVHEIPPFVMGATRFFVAGALLFTWCLVRKEKIWNAQQAKVASISGIMLLFIGNGAVIWAEQRLPSSFVAVLVSASPIWFVVLDKPKWKENFSNRSTLIGLVIGFIGVILLFSERAGQAFSSTGDIIQIIGLIILIFGSISWAGGSLYSKYKSSGSAVVNSAWQMLAGGFVFLVFSFLSGEWKSFEWSAISGQAWFALAYLILMGSLAAYSAYVWLLQVRPAIQVSTYAYVNPVVAVLLGVFFAGEKMSVIQIAGLAIILTSLLLINLAKYKQEKKAIAHKKDIGVEAA